MATTTLTVRQTKLADLRENPANPRRINPDRLNALKRSLEADPDMLRARPLIALPDGTVICGNMRLRAARELGWKTIPTVTADLDPARINLWTLRDNQEYGEWEDDNVADILAHLAADGIDLALTGFPEDEIDRLLNDLANNHSNGEDPDPGPGEPPTEPRSKPGDIYQLGPHRLMCASCEDPEAVTELLAGAQPRMLLTDPPYGVQLDNEWRDRAGLNGHVPAEPSYMRERTPDHQATTMSGDTRADWADAYALVPSLEYGLVWHASAHCHEVANGLERIGWELVQQIIWTKPMLVLSRQLYHWQHEPAFLTRKRGAKIPWHGGTKNQTTVWESASPKQIVARAHLDPETDGPVNHPSQKPIVLYTRPLRNHLKRGAAFYEPFAGSGSAIVAAEQTGRVCYAMEIDPRYCDVIRDRYEALTGG